MANRALSALRRLSIVIAVAIVFVFGLATTVYLSLRSPEVKVPDVLGKDRFEAERILGDAGLNFRVRATRPSSEKADTVLFQLPRAGDVVKMGQTVAMDVSRTVKEGESSEAVAPEKQPEENTGEKAGNKNANEANTNENKSKRNKNTNKNTNENANAGNRNENDKPGNRNANAIRPPTNKNDNTGNANTTPSTNSNRPTPNTNSNRGANQNENRRPAVPKASPVSRPNR